MTISASISRRTVFTFVVGAVSGVVAWAFSVAGPIHTGGVFGYGAQLGLPGMVFAAALVALVWRYTTSVRLIFWVVASVLSFVMAFLGGMLLLGGMMARSSGPLMSMVLFSLPGVVGALVLLGAYRLLVGRMHRSAWLLLLVSTWLSGFIAILCAQGSATTYLLYVMPAWQACTLAVLEQQIRTRAVAQHVPRQPGDAPAPVAQIAH